MANRSIRITTCLLLVFIQSLSFAQGSWVRESIPTSRFLKSICFVDSLYGWVAGDSGTIMHTANGGAAWTVQNAQTSNNIEYLYFLNRNLGWASEFNYTTVPYGTVLLKTTNGGATWQGQPFPVENIFMSCILFTDSLHGWMGGKPNGIYKTSDGGTSWTQALIDTSTLAFFPVLDIAFYNQQYGYASGGILDVAGVIWRTKNGGNSWDAIDPAYAPADEVHKLHLFDSVNVMGAGGDPDFGYGVGMIRSTDGGVTWIYHELPIQGNAYDLGFRNASEVWSPLGAKRKLIYSLDAGVTWTPIPTPDSTSIYKLTFPDSLHGYAAGKDGAFLKYHPLVVQAVTPVTLKQGGFFLSQNYPNPVNHGTTIRFEIPSAGPWISGISHWPNPLIQVVVFDILGKEVAAIAGNDLLPGLHEVTFDATDLPDGCYFYSLRLYDVRQSVTVAGPRRMIVLKNR